MIIEVIGLIGLIAIMTIMDRYLEFANHSCDFAAANLLSESQTCLVEVAAKNL